jgi:uncharacterized protein YdeI (YjbR/CyaY-like superfamily)
MNPVFFPSSSAFRHWLQTEGKKQLELWVGFYKKWAGKPSITYPEAVDEALCFGWIDGVRKSVDADSYMVRFTPRKPRSQWSAVNIRHVERLTKAGRIFPEGLKASEGARGQSRTYSYEQRDKAKFKPQDEQRFRLNRKAWDFFQSQPPWYRRTSTFWVVRAKKEETRKRSSRFCWSSRRAASLSSRCGDQRFQNGKKSSEKIDATFFHPLRC